MGRMIRFEVEVLASVGGFSVILVANAIPFLMIRTFRKGIALSDSILTVNWVEDY
jgi:hypothetical protein